jgi:hypothetical protein
MSRGRAARFPVFSPDPSPSISRPRSAAERVELGVATAENPRETRPEAAMPKVWLDRDEAEYGDLPSVCMRCGDEATVTKDRNFSWYPQWVIVLLLAGLLPFLIVALLMTKRMRLMAPMCDRHAGHWLRFRLFAFGGLVGIFGLVITGAFLLAANDRTLNDVGGGVMVFSGLAFLVWLFVAAFWQISLIRAIEITDDDMRLAGVSEEFREALREQRRAEREEEEDRRRRRKKRVDED